MSKRALITGVTGQDGAYLSKLLLEKGYRVFGGLRRTGNVSDSRLAELGIAGQVELVDFEMLEITNLVGALETILPDEIYNLAAQSFVGTSFRQPVYTADVGALGVLRLLEAIRVACPSTRFYQASTSEMFGKAQASPQDELTPFYPRSPYGVSKLFAHWTTINYREAYGMHASSGILFNHESPLRGQEFVTRKVTKGLAMIKHGRLDHLTLGNIDAERDWGYAADYVDAMWRMLQQPSPDDYVVASGETNSVRRFIEVAAAHLGFRLAWEGSGATERGIDAKTNKMLVAIDPGLYRPAEVERLQGRATKAEERLGWRRKISFEGLVSMMAEADEKRVIDGNFSV